MVNEDNVNNIDTLAKEIDNQAVEWRETDSPRDSATGTGIRRQFAESETFPAMIMYLSRNGTPQERAGVEIKSMWINEQGERIERPAEYLTSLRDKQE